MTNKVGIIGLGNMGQPIAQRVAASTFDAMVYDLRDEPLAALKALGAEVAASPSDIAATCNVICIVVNSDTQLQDLMVGSGGLLDAARPGTAIVIHSTVAPKVCHELEALGRARGIDVVDAPVSGAETGARAGTLTLMIGGSSEAIAKCYPVFESYASDIFHLGAIGMGQVAKITNNLMMLVNTLAVREGLRVAAKAGIDRAKMIDSAQVSTGDSWSLGMFEYFIDMADRYPGGLEAFQNSAAKDLKHAVELANDLGVPAPAATLALDSIREYWKREL